MAGLRRRDILAGSGAAIAASALHAHPARAGSSVLTLYSPSLPMSKTLAAGAGRPMAIEGDIVAFWRRKLARHQGPLQGFTSWSDFVLLRGLAAEKGLRLTAEATLSVGPGKTLFRWIMA